MTQGFLRAYRRAQKFLQSVPARTDGSFVSEQSDGITRLHSMCQTVTPEEVARLESKPRRRSELSRLTTDATPGAERAPT